MFRWIVHRAVAGTALCVALASSAWCQIPEFGILQTLEATPQEVQPDPEDMPQELKFGNSVAIRGNIALVGMPDAYDGAGRVAEFTRNASGSWVRSATLLSPDPIRAQFGWHVAFKDNTALVAASGAIYVFKRSSTGAWTRTQKLTLPAQQPYTYSLQYHERVVAVGVWSEVTQGAVYVFHLTTTGKLAQTRVLSASDATAGDYFGYDVALTHDTLVVGSPRGVQPGSPGAAYVFKRSGDRWTERQKLTGSDVDPDGSFGDSVAIDKGMIVVAATGTDARPNETNGAAYVFTSVTGAWVEQQKLVPDPTQFPTYYNFGEDIAMFNDRVVIGAHETFFSGFFGAGLGFTYARSGNQLTPIGVAVGNQGLESLSLSSYTLIMGAPYGFSCSNAPCIGSATVHNVRGR